MAKIPFISIISGAWTPNYYKQNLGTFPDYLENSFTRVLPQYLKNGVFTRVVNSYLLNRKGPIARKLNRVANKLNINLHFKSAPEMSYGDYTFVCDSMEFLGLKPTKEFPAENYIGPILADAGQVRKSNQLDFDIEKHLQRSGRSILLTMGSSFLMKEIFLRILKTLNQTNYNVIATYTDILKEDEIPMLNDNILLKKFISNINTLNTNVDLAIIHGGRGTVYTAAYSGKPAIGIPSMHEQQANLDSLVRHAMALRLSKKYFSEKNLLVAMETIFNNYDFYLKNAQSLAKKLPKPQGDIKAAKRILQIVTKTSNEEL